MTIRIVRLTVRIVIHVLRIITLTVLIEKLLMQLSGKKKEKTTLKDGMKWCHRYGQLSI